MKDKDMKHDILNDVLNMNSGEIIEQSEQKLPTTYKPSLNKNPKEEIDNDTKYIRQNFYDLIEKGHGAIDELLAVADQSQHPRAYEVLATMIKTMGDMNNDLLAMHEKKQKLSEEKPDSPETVNNNLYVGSTSDLLKLLNKDE
ncbi:terminase [bacterium]|nr:terminase [bacterium]